MEQTGTVIDDPRAAAVDGRVLLLSDGDALEEIGGLQLLFPRRTVTIVVSGGLMSTGLPDLAIPVDDAIGVATDVAPLSRRARSSENAGLEDAGPCEDASERRREVLGEGRRERR